MSEPKFYTGDPVFHAQSDSGVVRHIRNSEYFIYRPWIDLSGEISVYTGWGYQTEESPRENYFHKECDLRIALEDEKPTWESFKEKTGWCPVKEVV